MRPARPAARARRSRLAADEAGLEVGVVEYDAEMVDAVLRVLHPQPVLGRAWWVSGRRRA